MTTSTSESRRIRELRPPGSPVDPWRAPPWLVEQERATDGGSEPVLTLFLRGAECPFTCVYCDLWQETLPAATPLGALPRQIDLAFEEVVAAGHDLARMARIKLYNASNFFDERAVPARDRQAILARVARFPEVTVECHPRLVGKRCLAFAELLPGCLEVAMGLETVHATAFARLNRGMELDDFERAAETLTSRGIGVRAFVLLGVPFVPPEEAVLWAMRSVEHAVQRGAGRVVLIPVRGGNGEMERLEALGDFQPPTLEQLEEALDRSLEVAGGRGIVTADLWDLDRLVRCTACAPARRRRLEAMNLSGEIAPVVACSACGHTQAHDREPAALSRAAVVAPRHDAKLR